LSSIYGCPIFSALFGVRHDHPKRGGWVDHKERLTRRKLLLNASQSALLGPALEGLAWGIKTSQHHNGIEDQARRETRYFAIGTNVLEF
jgi:hypothetical protein